MLRRPRLPVLLALSLAAGCRGGKAGPPPERFLPAAPDLALIVPEAGRASRELAALYDTVSGFPGASDLAGARAGLAAQLGFDPLDPEAVADQGIDPRRGAALARFERRSGDAPGPATLLVLPAGDPPRLETLLARLARERLGAPERTAEAHGAVSVVVFRRAPGAPPALAYAVSGRTVVLAPGPGGAAAVAESVARPEGEALSAAPAWTTARAALSGREAAVAWVPPGSRFLQGMWAVKDGLALGVSAGEGRLQARAAILLGAREASFKALAAGGAAGKLAARLDPGAPLALRWDGDPAALGAKLVPILPRAERARLAAHGVDPLKDLAEQLAPGAAAALSLSPALDLTDLSEEDIRRDPLRVFRFEVVADVKDPARARAVSERIVGGPGRRVARANPGPEDPSFRIATPSGEIAWRLDGARLALAGGAPGTLETLVARLDGAGPGFRAPTSAAAGALEGGLGGGALDAQRLVASVRALPDEAFGTGPSGFVVRSVVDRFLDPAARLAAVSGEVDLAPGALLVDVAVEARGGNAGGGRP